MVVLFFYYDYYNVHNICDSMRLCTNEPLLVASYEVSGNKGGVHRAPPWRGSVYYLRPHSSPLQAVGSSLPAGRQVWEDNKFSIDFVVIHLWRDYYRIDNHKHKAHAWPRIKQRGCNVFTRE